MKIMLVRDRNVLNTNWLIYFANLLAQSGHQVIIACDTYSKMGELASGYSLEKDVSVINLNQKTTSKIKNIYRKIRGKIIPPYFRFKKLIKQEKPDVIVCYFPTDLYNVTRFQKHNIPIIQMMHCYPPMILNKILKKCNFIKSLCIKSFMQVSAFQVLMPSFIDKIDPIFKPKKIVAIGNPVKQYNSNDCVNLNNENKKIIYITRVEKTNKRPHLLVESFAKIAKEFPDWKVEIYGLRKYPEYDKEINDFISANNLKNQVFLMGYSNNVIDVYKTADINAFTSAQEGFGLTLADGLSLGIPAIGFDYATAVNELIINDYNGFLAKDVDDFAQKLKTLITDKNLRIKMGKNAHKSMMKYSPEIIIEKWTSILEEVTNGTK